MNRQQQTVTPIAKTLDMASLTPNQQAVFGKIALGVDGAHHRATLKALERKGLIVACEETLPGVRPITVTRYGALPIRVTRYMVPLHLHIQWCEWCSDQLQEEEGE